MDYSKISAEREQSKGSEKGRAARCPLPLIEEDADVGVVPSPEDFETFPGSKIPPQVDPSCTSDGPVQDDRFVSVWRLVIFLSC
jgi:hypothetical protein